MIFVNLRMEGRGLLPDTVMWLPEERFPFFRLTEAPISMPWLAPEGKTVITADLGAEVSDPLWREPDEELARRCLDSLAALVPQAHRRYLGAKIIRIPIAYAVFDLSYESVRRSLKATLPVEGLLTVGRNGEFGHWLMEDVFWRTTRRVTDWATRLRA
jgi:protoporphyrinogen oxidase